MLLPSPVEWTSATLPKAGNRPEENEDAVAAAPDELRFAVADGASESWESGLWAARLATAFVRRPPTPADFADWLTEARDWSPPAANGPIPWYASVKQEQGSFAALAGLDLRRSRSVPGEWTWRAIAIGDSCVLHIHGTTVEAAFPLSSPDGFGNRPPLVPSSPEEQCPEPVWFAGRAEPGDLLLLATDTASARLLDPPALEPALVAVRQALRERSPTSLLDWFRELQQTANDDVSMIAIRLPDAGEIS